MLVEDRIAALEARVAALEGRGETAAVRGAGSRGAGAAPGADPAGAAPGAGWTPLAGAEPGAGWTPLAGADPGAGWTPLAGADPGPAGAAPGAGWTPLAGAGSAPAGVRRADPARLAAAAARVVPRRGHAAPRRDLEDFLGGSVLAWLGGVAVLAGLAFLLTIAVSRGWIGEGARTALAGALSLALLGAGVWLRERRGRYEAALAAAAVGVGGSFGTLVVAGPVYGLVPEAATLLGAFAVGGLATALSVRWNAQVMGWLGLLGALLAPAALGADEPLYVAVAYAATAGVIVRQRWTKLAFLAFSIAALQLLYWLFDESAGGATLLLVLAGFGALTAALAIGTDANRRGARPAFGPAPRPRIPYLAAGLLANGAALVALAGWDDFGGAAWLGALALVHVALGLAATRAPRVSRELALVALAVGLLLANVAFAEATSGLPLALGWALSALPFAALLGARRPGHESRVADLILGRPHHADRILALAGLAGQLSLAVLQAAEPNSLAGAGVPAGALIAAGALAVVAFSCARLAGDRWRGPLDVLALAALAHFTGLALEGVALTVSLAGLALGLASLARHSRDRLTGWAAVVFAAGALVHALATLAPPEALLDGLAAPLAAAAALVAVAGSLAAVSRVPLGDERLREVLLAAAAVVALYLASTGIVTLAGGGQDGQTALSVLWGVAGVGALLAGLLGDRSALRRGALALLAVTAAKVFVYDLSSLESLYRVGSLIGLGLLLLCGAFAWQHVRPRDGRLPSKG